MQIPLPPPSWQAKAAHICEYVSVIFGIIGTALMSRRYMRKFWRGILFTTWFPFTYLYKSDPRQYFISSAKLNENIPDSLPDITLGIILLFWGFFLQLVALFLK